MANDPIILNGSGLSLGQKLALAATMICKPCGCEDGSGSGSGSGSGGRPPYCGCTADDFSRAASLFATVEVDCMGISETIELAQVYAGGCVQYDGQVIVGGPSTGAAVACCDDISVDVNLDYTYAIRVSIGCLGCDNPNCISAASSIWVMTVVIQGNIGGVYYEFGASAAPLLLHRITLTNCLPIAFNEKILEGVCYIPVTCNADLDCFVCCTGVPAVCDFTVGCTDQMPTNFTSGVGCLVTINISE